MLPMTGTTIIIPALYSPNFRYQSWGQYFWLVYDILHSNTTAIICGVIAIISGFVGLIAEIYSAQKVRPKAPPKRLKGGLCFNLVKAANLWF